MNRKRQRDVGPLLYGYDPDLPVLEGDPRLFPGRGLGTAWHPSQPVRNEWSDWGDAGKALYDFRVRRVLPVSAAFAGDAFADALGARLSVQPFPQLVVPATETRDVTGPPTPPTLPFAIPNSTIVKPPQIRAGGRPNWDELGLGHAFGPARPVARLANCVTNGAESPITPASLGGVLVGGDHGCGAPSVRSADASGTPTTVGPTARQLSSLSSQRMSPPPPLPHATGLAAAAVNTFADAVDNGGTMQGVAAAASPAPEDARLLLDPLAPWNVALIRALADATRRAAGRRQQQDVGGDGPTADGAAGIDARRYATPPAATSARYVASVDADKRGRTAARTTAPSLQRGWGHAAGDESRSPRGGSSSSSSATSPAAAGTSVSPRAHSPSAVSGISASVSVVLARRVARRRVAGEPAIAEADEDSYAEDDDDAIGSVLDGAEDAPDEDDGRWGSDHGEELGVGDGVMKAFDGPPVHATVASSGRSAGVEAKWDAANLRSSPVAVAAILTNDAPPLRVAP